MASAIKHGLASAAHAVTGSSTDKANTDSQGHDKRDAYRLRITAGPSYDKSLQKEVAINSPSAHVVSSHCALSIRIRDYTGLPSSSPRTSEPYFSLPQHSKDTFSIAWAFTPPHDIPASNLLFGLDTGHNPLRKFGIPKSLVNTAFRIVKEFVDPSLACDAGADEPWVRGPAVAGATTTLNIGDIAVSPSDPQVQQQQQQQQQQQPGPAFPDPALLVEGATSPAAASHRDQDLGLPSDVAKRRKHLLSESKRAHFVLQKGRTYYFDFSNGYIDWGEYALKLPGFSVPVLKYIGGGGKASSSSTSSTPASPRTSQEMNTGSSPGVGTNASPSLLSRRESGGSEAGQQSGKEGKEGSHKVRFFLKDVVGGEVYFVVMATLLTGDELRVALEQDKGGVGGQGVRV